LGVAYSSEMYVKEIFKKIDSKQDLSEIPKSQRREKAKSLLWCAEKSETRNDAIKLAYARGGYSMKEIGDYYRLHYSRMSRIIAQQRKAKGKTLCFFVLSGT